MPAPSGRGRPREVCDRVCAARARQRRAKAARLLEFADHLDEVVAEIRAGKPAGGLSVGWEEKRAVSLRSIAEQELRGLPL